MKTCHLTASIEGNVLFSVVAEYDGHKEQYRYQRSRGINTGPNGIAFMTIEYETVCDTRSDALLLYAIRWDGRYPDLAMCKRSLCTLGDDVREAIEEMGDVAFEARVLNSFHATGSIVETLTTLGYVLTGARAS